MPVDQAPKLIAIVDDDEAMQDSLRDLMEAAGLVAHCSASAEEFVASSLRVQVACLILDIRMPNMSGLQLQTRLKEEECNIPIIFITAHGDARMRIRCERVQSSSLQSRSIITSYSEESGPHLICEQSRLLQSRVGSLKRFPWKIMRHS
jgi:CheY-like chemotaxis protein